MKSIVFLEDFATKKKGEQWECDNMLASHLVHHDKVAKYLEIEVEKEAETSEPVEEKPKKKAKK